MKPELLARRVSTSVHLGVDASSHSVRRLIERSLRRHVKGYEPESTFVAVRRLNLRLVSEHGLPSERSLGRAWTRALSLALDQLLDGLGPGVSDDVVYFATDLEAQTEWLRRWTGHRERAWWSSAVAATMNVEEPLEPAHVLMHWARETPARLPRLVFGLSRDTAAFDAISPDDWVEVWRRYEWHLRQGCGDWMPATSTNEVVRRSTAPGRLLAALREHGITSLDSRRQPVIARFVARVIVPGLTDTAAIDELVANAWAAVRRNEATTQRTVEHAAIAPVRTLMGGDVASTTSSPLFTVPDASESTTTVEDAPFDNAGFTLLVRPLLAEAMGRSEREDFATAWETLVRAAFWTVHGPRPEHLRVALEREGEFLWWWYAVLPTSEWLEEPPARDLAFVAELGESLPQDWGDSAIERLLHLVRRPAHIRAQLPHVHATFAVDQSDIEVRRRGWDIDPGWVPMLDRVLRFHYEELS